MNGNRSLSFLLPKASANTLTFDMVEEESIVEYDGHKYRIKNVAERVVKQTPVKVITAPHVFFDLVDDYRYTTLTNGAKSISQVLAFIFDDTDWTFSVIDSFGTVEFENFGNANCLDLFSKVIERYGAEFDLNGNDVIIREQIGSLIDLQFRYNHNVKTFNRTVDSSNLSTYIKGTGKQNEDGTYIVEADYTSPNSSIFGIKHAPPYSNESITQLATLEENLQRQIQDTPEVAIELEFVVLLNAGYTKSKPDLGDTVPTIYEPLNNIDLDLRVMEIEEYPETNKAPKVMLATSKYMLEDADFSYQKRLLDKIWDENSKTIRYNVYNEAVKRATEALNNSLTELEYPVGMGIVARDPNDANRFVALRSSGIGVTTDGGLTFPDAITADGVTTSLLTAGQIKTNNIQIIGNDDLFYWDGNYLIAIDAVDANKFVRLNSDGLYIAKGALTIERPDGYKVINDGLLNMEFALGSAKPSWREENPTDATQGVTVFNTYWRTRSTTWKTCDAFFFEHKTRYLHFDFALFTENISGSRAYVKVVDSLQNPTTLAYYSTDVIEANVDPSTNFVIDLGTPTGAMKVVYIQIQNLIDTAYTYCRTTRQYLKG